MKIAMTCFCLVLVALAVISPSACFPRTAVYYPSEQMNMWEMMEPSDDMEEMDENEAIEELFQKDKESLLDIQATGCISTVYVMAFTSGGKTSGSHDLPYLVLILNDKEVGEAIFPDNPGNDMLKNKGDCWNISMSSFNFKKSCITKADIISVLIKEGGDNGWKIASVITVVFDGQRYEILTTNMNANRWIDGDDSYYKKKFALTIQK